MVQPLASREATRDTHWASGRGAFKGAALIGAFAIIVAAWWWDASLLTAAADANLRLIKIVTGKLPFDWGSKVESALRIFGADRALLLIEGIAIAKIVMLGFAYPFRRRRGLCTTRNRSKTSVFDVSTK